MLAFNVAGEWARPGFDATAAWLPLAEAQGPPARALMAATAALVLWAMARPPQRSPRYVATQALVLFWMTLALAAAVQFYAALGRGEIATRVPIPVALLSAAGLAALAWELRARSFRPPDPACPVEVRVLAAVFAAVAVTVIFTWGQFFLAGPVVRPGRADCIIVMGSGVKPDGRPSVSLYDRTRAACELWKRGAAPALIFSGGPVPKLEDRLAAARPGLSEADVMDALARDFGVPAEARVRDPDGHSTFRTVLSCRRIMQAFGWRTAIVVSHDYHLSRTALAFHRGGLEVRTWPAPRSQLTLKDVTIVIRESAAWVYYYFRPLWQPFRVAATERPG